MMKKTISTFAQPLAAYSKQDLYNMIKHNKKAVDHQLVEYKKMITNQLAKDLAEHTNAQMKYTNNGILTAIGICGSAIMVIGTMIKQDIDSKFAKVDAEFTKVYGKINKLDDKIDKIDDKLNQLDKKLSVLIATISK